jgi:hypothetical protein
MDDDSPFLTPPSSPFSKKDCLLLLGKKGSMGCDNSPQPLPPACDHFDEIKVELQRRLSNQATHAVAFQGLPPGEAAAAMSSRDKGHLSHAQIQRRMTTNSKTRLW